MTKFDGAFQVPRGGRQLLELIQGEAESGAVGTRIQGAGLWHEGQLLDDRAWAHGVHKAADHLDGQDDVSYRVHWNLQEKEERSGKKTLTEWKKNTRMWSAERSNAQRAQWV